MHWHAEYRKYHVFSSFETDLCTGILNRPPLLAYKICLFQFTLQESSDKKIVPFFFWPTLEFGHKPVPILSEDLFFGLHLISETKTVSILGEDLF